MIWIPGWFKILGSFRATKLIVLTVMEIRLISVLLVTSQLICEKIPECLCYIIGIYCPGKHIYTDYPPGRI